MSASFLYTPQSSDFTPIDFPDAVSTQASDINDLGQVIGVYYDGVQLHCFLYDQKGYTSIDAPDADSTSLSGINNFGHVTGSYVGSVARTFRIARVCSNSIAGARPLAGRSRSLSDCERLVPY